MALALAEAHQVSHDPRDLAFAIECLRFTLTGKLAALPLDFRDGAISSATLNGQPIPTTLTDGPLLLPAKFLHPGENKFEAAFTSRIAAAGAAITRYEDKDDGSEYIYSLFVPMDASMAFPCFDQPDLKGRFTLSISAPNTWTVIANTAPQGPKWRAFEVAPNSCVSARRKRRLSRPFLLPWEKAARRAFARTPVSRRAMAPDEGFRRNRHSPSLGASRKRRT